MGERVFHKKLKVNFNVISISGFANKRIFWPIEFIF